MVCNFPTRTQGTGRKIAYHRISLRRIQGKGKQLLSLPLCEAQDCHHKGDHGTPKGYNQGTLKGYNHACALRMIKGFALAWSPFGGQSCALRMHDCPPKGDHERGRTKANSFAFLLF